MRWLGPGIVIGHEGLANEWISGRNAVVSAAGNHVRLAEVEEQLPWHDLYDSRRDTGEQTHFDLCPPGPFRDLQYPPRRNLINSWRIKAVTVIVM